MSVPELKEMLKLPDGFRTQRVNADPENDLQITNSNIKRQIHHFVDSFKPLLSHLRDPLGIWLADGAKPFSSDLENAFGYDLANLIELVPVQYMTYEGDTPLEIPILDETKYKFPDVDGRDVILFDDIADTTRTALRFIVDVGARGGRVRDAAFVLEKPESSPWRPRIKVSNWDSTVRKWVLFEVDDLWFEDYGMDTDGLGRGNDESGIRWRRDREPAKVEYYRKLGAEQGLKI